MSVRLVFQVCPGQLSQQKHWRPQTRYTFLDPGIFPCTWKNYDFQKAFVIETEIIVFQTKQIFQILSTFIFRTEFLNYMSKEKKSSQALKIRNKLICKFKFEIQKHISVLKRFNNQTYQIYNFTLKNKINIYEKKFALFEL